MSRHEEFDADNGGWNITKSHYQNKKDPSCRTIASKGTHAASKLINALILLNCDQSGGRTERPRTCDIAAMLCVSERKVDRVKKKFVQEGLELTPFHGHLMVQTEGVRDEQIPNGVRAGVPPATY